MTPEEKARVKIDQMFEDAGWQVVDRDFYSPTITAAATLKELGNYPIVLTRSLDTAKQWLRDHARGSERFGILASSKAERLKAISINVRFQPDFVHWFL